MAGDVLRNRFPKFSIFEIAEPGGKGGRTYTGGPSLSTRAAGARAPLVVQRALRGRNQPLDWPDHIG